MLISTENAYVGEIEMDGEIPISKKKGYTQGFGIKNIITIVESYDGLYSIETDDGVFILQILIPLKINKAAQVNMSQLYYFNILFLFLCF